MKKFHLILAIFLAFFMVACSTKTEFTASQSVSVLLKSKQFRFNELGFLYKDAQNTRLELYKLAQPLFALEIKPSKICVNKYCTNKQNFNERFFNNAYYDALLEDILSAKPIFSSANLKKNECGFSQKITSKSGKFDISYKVCNGDVDFNDSKNKIKFTMKKLENQ